jgi:hypothetical protein
MPIEHSPSFLPVFQMIMRRMEQGESPYEISDFE